MNDNTAQIGKNIKTLREQTGFTQNALANYLGVDQNTLAKIEKNAQNITSDMLDKLSALFGVPTEAFNDASIPTNQMMFAHNPNSFTKDDLDAISAINRIALNLNFMTQLLKNADGCKWNCQTI